MDGYLSLKQVYLVSNLNNKVLVISHLANIIYHVITFLLFGNIPLEKFSLNCIVL